MRFWDSSAIVPLLLKEANRTRMLSYRNEDAHMFVWWATPVEVASAVARREREGELDVSEASAVLQRLDVLASSWYELQPSPRLRLTARRLLRVHSLCTADAQQLAAAILAADGEDNSLEFVCLDEQLGEAARREGFPVLA